MVKIREKHFARRRRSMRTQRSAAHKEGVKKVIDEQWPHDGKREIFKAQLSLANGLPFQTILLYNKSRSCMTEIRADESSALVKMFRRDKKMYVTITYVKDEAGPKKYKLLIGARVMDRDW